MNRHLLSLAAAALLPLVSSASAADEGGGEPHAVLLDTDLGAAVDDAFALGLLLASPEVSLEGVTTVGGDARTRAMIACRFLEDVGRGDIPVAIGAATTTETDSAGMHQYGLRPARTFPAKEPAVELLYRQLKDRPGAITILASGPLTNIAALLEVHPECREWIKRVVVMGGAVKVGYSGKPPAEAEWNFNSDPAAARAVLASRVPLVVVPLDATVTAVLCGERLGRLLNADSPLTNRLATLYDLADEESPVLHDAVAASLLIDDRFCELEEMRLEVDDRGVSRAVEGEPNCRVAMKLGAAAFLDWLTSRLAAAKMPVEHPSLPPAKENRAEAIETGGLPRRVHVFEDYETDIERRWWLSGRAQEEEVPPPLSAGLPNNRACRGLLTRSFDARMGDQSRLYRAVIFNPVPGPPMGPRTRLSFRYRLAGTDTIQVQIFSLSNGYHRYLRVSGLAPGEWRRATVDMTLARRPDGSGGPLSEDERIDDIQFYVDREAEIWIDDIVLFEAAGEEETRPFPRRILFSGWFDTGRQGAEWPGEFEIAPHEKPRTWKTAKSIKGDGGKATLTVGLRGQRPLPDNVKVRFSYKLESERPGPIEILLMDGESGGALAARVDSPAAGKWQEADVAFTPGTKAVATAAGEIEFTTPDGVLLIDDLLIYEPGS